MKDSYESSELCLGGKGGSHPPFFLRGRELAYVLILSVGTMVPSIAGAHAGLAKSSPGSRASLNRPPKKIELCFTEDIELRFSTVKLFAPNGESVALEALTFGAEGHRCIVSEVQNTTDMSGTYTVKYKVLSQDGHMVDYGYTYELRPFKE